MAAETSPSPTRSAGRWSSLERPARTLLWLAIALVIVELYHATEYLVVHIFSVILLFVFAGIVALLLTPVIDRMEMVPPFKGRRPLAVMTVLVLALGLIGGAMALIAPAVAAQAKSLPDLERRAISTISSAQEQINRFGIPVHLSLPNPGSSALLGSALGVIGGTLTTLVDLLLVIVISVYLLIQGRELIAATRKLFPGHTQLFDFTLVAVGATVAAYARGQLIMSIVMGLYTGIALSAIGVHYAIFIGIATFFLEFLPLVGAPVGMGVAIIVALFQSPLLALLAALVAVGGHALEAYILGPRVTGHITRLHPLAAMAALLIGAELAGVLGALFAIPLAALANVFLGALYRSRRGEEALSTSEEGTVHPEALPRLGEEIAQVDDRAPIQSDPVPRVAGEN